MNRVALIILDGWGEGELNEHNAIHVAKTPFFDHLIQNYPHTTLQASGEYVGLPEGQIGGSEVGHLTIGAGRVIFQQLPRINRALNNPRENEGIFTKKEFGALLTLAKQHSLHLIGLISPGGVHSHQNHLFQILELLKNEGCKPPIIHMISDGRDTPPHSGKDSAKQLEHVIDSLSFGTIATLCGRYYAMDRDKNLNRTDAAASLYTHPHSDPKHILVGDDTGNPISNLNHIFELFYAREATDEFIEPTLVNHSFNGIQDGEPIFFFNFRSDRMKQLITTLDKKLPSSEFFTMTQYDNSYPYHVIFEKEIVSNTLGEVLSRHNLKQLRAAETEKYPHVTYFFNGGVEVIFPQEARSLAESNKVKHDLLPKMKAQEIEENVSKAVKDDPPHFILVNFANPDMVGHTGNFKAVVEGVETVDAQLKKLCGLLTSFGYICCITADHGNADIMFDPVRNEPHTAHTLNPVPFIIYDVNNEKNQHLHLDQNPSNGLSKIAGTVLELMEVEEEGFDSLIVKA